MLCWRYVKPTLDQDVILCSVLYLAGETIFPLETIKLKQKLKVEVEVEQFG